MSTKPERVSIKTLATFAGILGHGSLAMAAYVRALKGKQEGRKVKIMQHLTGWTVTVDGQSMRFM
jgi:hypothetical protein